MTNPVPVEQQGESKLLYVSVDESVKDEIRIIFQFEGGGFALALKRESTLKQVATRLDECAVLISQNKLPFK